MLKYQLILVLLLSVIINLHAQDIKPDTTWNQLDNQGRKQGWWKKYYPDQTIMYVGFFKDDIPLGLFKRYFETGAIKAIMNYYHDGVTVYTKLFYMNGEPAAEGKYYKTKKDSIWRYYSYYSHSLTYTETYLDGLKNGLSAKYYENGKVAELMDWKLDMKHGDWFQFYEDSTLRLSSQYTNDELNGPYKVYNPAGILLVDGQYINNEPDGTWHYYDDEGQLKFELLYDNGKVLNGEVLEEEVKKFMEEMEKNLGTIPEPDLENIVPEK
jgi:antitoxin component YwqK of YwqJK toxin-antitoxin module